MKREKSGIILQSFGKLNVTIVDLRINETRQTGAVFNRTYRAGGECVHLFLEFTIDGSHEDTFGAGAPSSR